ncbi:hypothetical protein N7493_005125 [Penicillium malachiteum]|uniref:Uncharacterized protein n=1 Tax=Penicillium malachiteum TaxID=1324776 RepID=A0AAD6MW87_9EURO|nr:hypothetical protein N7493_005125 [Penicillium malachiteum]
MLAYSTDITNFFTLPDGAGTCTGSNTETFLGEMLDDATTLIKGMVAAVTAATTSATTEQGAKDKVVAQKLFTSFFGVAFEGNDALSAYEDAWAIVKSAITNVEEFLEDQVYTCAKLPPVLFCDNFGNGFDWDSQAKNAQGKAIVMSDGFEPAIKNIYSAEYAASATSEPYWIPELNRYIFTSDVKVNSGQTFCGGKFLDGPFTATMGAGESEQVDLLAKVPYTTPSTTKQLSKILPISSTLFHELFHMTTYWEGEDVGETAEHNTDFVTDITYDLFEALDLAMGLLKIPVDPSSDAEGDGDSESDSDAEDDGESGSDSDSGSDSGSSDSDSEYYSFEDAAQNAESYVFFAVAWWNYAKTWTEGDSAVFYTGCAETWDWLGPVTSCA